MPLRILPPEKAKQKARDKVKKFQADKRKRALEEKLNPPSLRAIPSNGKAEKPRKGGLREGKHALNKELYAAVKSGNRDELEKLLSKGANPHYRHEQLIKDSWGRTVINTITPLMTAAVRGFNGIAKVLIAAGADVDAISRITTQGISSTNGMTPLMYASESGHLTTVETLVESGANIKTTFEIERSPNSSPYERPKHKAALDFATENNHISGARRSSLANFLRANGAKLGADQNALDEELRNAIDEADVSLVTQALTDGANVHWIDHSGHNMPSPLGSAVFKLGYVGPGEKEHNLLEIAKALVDAGADITIAADNTVRGSHTISFNNDPTPKWKNAILKLEHYKTTGDF
ncbi:MAG: ankyrin repeat domain-containing protein [bacterium]|nr:ankyrin repeat domain-containing protein [bacterium]